MYEFSGFDPATMSDDELLQKAQELHGKIVWAGRYGSVGMISGLQRLLEVVENERAQRVYRVFARDRENAMPDVIESDPDLAAAARVQQPVEKGKIVPQKKPRQTIQISNRPAPDDTIL